MYLTTIGEWEIAHYFYSSPTKLEQVFFKLSQLGFSHHVNAYVLHFAAIIHYNCRELNIHRLFDNPETVLPP